MQWPVKPLSTKSTLSGEPFQTGEVILCFLYKDENGEFQRADIKPSEANTFRPSGEILGRWTHEVRRDLENTQLLNQQLLQTSEELFMSLYNEAYATEDSSDRQLLKHFLALMLERKRILKPLGSRTEPIQKYFHSKTKQEFDVPVLEIVPEKLVWLQSQLGQLVV